MNVDAPPLLLLEVGLKDGQVVFKSDISDGVLPPRVALHAAAGLIACVMHLTPTAEFERVISEFESAVAFHRNALASKRKPEAAS